MVARYGIPPPSPALGRSKVHHRLRLSRHERLRLCLALVAPFTACLSLLLLVILVSSPVRFPDSPDEYQIRRVIPESDTPSSTTAEPLSSLWAPYSPYYPAGDYEASIREGCVLSQVNIVCFFPRVGSPITHGCSLIAPTPWSPIPNFRSGRVNPKGTQKTSSCNQLQRPKPPLPQGLHIRSRIERSSHVRCRTVRHPDIPCF